MPNRVLRLSAICRSAALNASTIDLNKRPNVPGAMSGQGGDGGRCSVPRTNDGINCELLHSATTGTPRIFPVVSTAVFSTFKLIRVLAYAGGILKMEEESGRGEREGERKRVGAIKQSKEAKTT